MTTLQDRVGSIEHIKNRLVRSDKIEIAGREWPVLEIVARLGERMTLARRERINQVIEHRTYNVAVVAEHLYDTGNISAVMRSAESYGFLPFHIIERPGAKYKSSDRISKGSEKWLDIYKWNNNIECVQGLRSQGYKVYSTSLNATTTLKELDYSHPIAIVFGNERDGITPEIEKESDGIIKIPMHGFAQSFNISVAAALTFADVHRLRTEKKGMSGDLSADEKLQLTANYYLRSVDNPEIYFRS